MGSCSRNSRPVSLVGHPRGEQCGDSEACRYHKRRYHDRKRTPKDALWPSRGPRLINLECFPYGANGAGRVPQADPILEIEGVDRSYLRSAVVEKKRDDTPAAGSPDGDKESQT